MRLTIFEYNKSVSDMFYQRVEKVFTTLNKKDVVYVENHPIHLLIIQWKS